MTSLRSQTQLVRTRTILSVPFGSLLFKSSYFLKKIVRFYNKDKAILIYVVKILLRTWKRSSTVILNLRLEYKIVVTT